MFKKVHIFLRFLMLPLKEIDEFLPSQGKIVDLGCGEGVLAEFLAKRKARKVIGIDINKKRLQQPRVSNLIFDYGDIRNFPLKGLDGVVLSDVLHHLNFADQNQLLSRIANSLNENGVLVIKEIDTKEFMRSKLSRFWDFVFYPKDRIFFSNSKDLKRFLVKLRFKVKILRACRFFPGSTTLYFCRKSFAKASP